MSTEESLPALQESAKRDWGRAALKAIPYIGEALDELIHGHVDELRWERLNRTLRELAEQMEEREIPPEAISKEEFAALLESLAPAIGRATSDEKRQLLRDLLLNAASLEPANPEWESARLAGQLLEALDAAAIAILAGIVELGGPIILRSMNDGGSSRLALRDDESVYLDLGYRWLVIDQAYRALSAAPARLVVAGGRGPDHAKTWLTPLGEFLIEWVSAE